MCGAVSGSEVQEGVEHNHAPDPGEIGVFKVLDTIKQTAVEHEDEPPRRVVSEALVGTSSETQARMPNTRNLTKTIRRKRNRVGALPGVPAHVDRLQIPEQFRQTLENPSRRFLLWDSHSTEDDDEDVDEEEDSRIIIFATDRCLYLLRNNRDWLFDGTFKASPTLFYQVFTIHCMLGNGALPCVYALLGNKSQPSYARVFQKIKDKEPRLEPRTVMCDFELAAINAMRGVFPEVEVSGCHFHLRQSIFRHILHEGLRSQYINDENIRNHVKYLGALAFVPNADVADTFDEIQDGDDFPQELESVYAYFEATYIGRRLRRGRRPPRFPIPMWNQSERVEAGMPRTNNLLEGWHNGIQSSLTGHHPTIWKFLTFLQKEELLQRSISEKVTAGNDTRYESEEQIKKTQRLQNIVRDYDNRTKIDFLRGISYNISMPT